MLANFTTCAVLTLIALATCDTIRPSNDTSNWVTGQDAQHIALRFGRGQYLQIVNLQPLENAPNLPVSSSRTRSLLLSSRYGFNLLVAYTKLHHLLTRHLHRSRVYKVRSITQHHKTPTTSPIKTLPL